MKTVAIWSSLKFANYGDDLQALAYAKLIKSMGYDVKLYQLDKSLAEMYGVRTVQTMDELCEGVNLCVIAGGGLLSPFNWLRRTLNRSYHEWELMFKELYDAGVKYGTKFCAISMGGDGKLHNPVLYYGRWRRKFFSSEYFMNGTVRLAGDVSVMKLFGKDFKYFPDMLFKAPVYFERELLPPTTKYRVGFNLKKGRYLDKHMISDIMQYAETHNDIEFHFTTTHLQHVGLNYQYLPLEESDNIKIDCYTSPQQLLGVLASMDVFITSMLHLGLTGLSCGTPFLSYRGPGKAKSFLRSIKGDWAIVEDKISFDQLKRQFFSKSKSDLYNQYDLNLLQKMKEDSAGQYEFCKNIVSQYS